MQLGLRFIKDGKIVGYTMYKDNRRQVTGETENFDSFEIGFNVFGKWYFKGDLVEIVKDNKRYECIVEGDIYGNLYICPKMKSLSDINKEVFTIPVAGYKEFQTYAPRFLGNIHEGRTEK